MVYNYISTHFYATCLFLYAWYKVNIEIFKKKSTLTFFTPSQCQDFVEEMYSYAMQVFFYITRRY